MNKPVAWAIKADNDFTEIGFDDELLEEIEQMYVMEGWKYEVIPLYTHPVKEQVETIEYTCPNCQTHVGLHVKHPVKDLEDIEINITWNETSMRDFGKEELAFAKAILRKAQEK